MEKSKKKVVNRKKRNGRGKGERNIKKRKRRRRKGERGCREKKREKKGVKVERRK